MPHAVAEPGLARTLAAGVSYGAGSGHKLIFAYNKPACMCREVQRGKQSTKHTVFDAKTMVFWW